MKFFLATILLAACLALAQSSVIVGHSYASVPVVRHVPVIRNVPVVRHVPVVDTVSVPVVHSVVPVQRTTTYISSPTVVRVGHSLVETPLAYGGWLKQKK